jgi:flagellar protein FlaJ
MSFLGFLPKLKTKASSKIDGADHTEGTSGKKQSINRDLLSADLFYHLTYMAAISTSKLPRNVLFQYASELPYTSSKYLKDITFLTQHLNYDYPEACRAVGESAKEPEVRALLLRMATALSSGENESDYLTREAYVVGETYEDKYLRSIDSLRKWTDAYTALILSSAMVVVICFVAMLIFPMDPKTTSALSCFTLIAILLAGWIMYRTSPKEIKTHSLRYKSAEQKLAATLFKLAIPLTIVVLLVTLLAKLPIGLAMMLIGAIIFPVGFIIIRDDHKIEKRDFEIAGFLRSLGSMSKAIRATITETLGRLDYNALNTLKKAAEGLNASLSFGLAPLLCWQRFVGETGSENIHRNVRTFYDATSLGGDAEIVGTECSNVAIKVSLLRGKRSSVSSAFSYLCIVMHATIVALLVGIYQILIKFSQALGGMEGMGTGGMEGLSGLPIFQLAQKSNQLAPLHAMSMALIFVLTLVNAAAIKVVEGGHNYKFLFYLGIMLAISGACLLFVPNMVSTIFSGVEMVK